jgi:hypothetical protein
MGQVVRCLQFALAGAYAPPRFTGWDVVWFVLIVLLAVVLLILAVSSWRACGLLSEIRDRLRQDGGGARERIPRRGGGSGQL